MEVMLFRGSLSEVSISGTAQFCRWNALTTEHIFGPIGMAAVLTKCKTITEEVFLITAELLAAKTPEARLESGMLFPAFSDMKVTSNLRFVLSTEPIMNLYHVPRSRF